MHNSQFMKGALFLWLVVLFLPSCGIQGGKNALSIDSIEVLQNQNFILSHNGKILLSANINDSLPAELYFDTGGGGDLIFDTAFARKVLKIDYKSYPLKDDRVLAITNHRIKYYDINKKVRVTIGDSVVEFNGYKVSAYFSRQGVDGMVSMPSKSGIWNIDFRSQRISLIDTVVMTDKTLRLDLYYLNGHYYVRDFPLSISGRTDSIDLVIDTGLSKGLFFCRSSPSDTLTKALTDSTVRYYDQGENFMLEHHSHLYFADFKGVFSNKVWVEHWALTRPWLYSGEFCGTLAGVLFLRHFNVVMDLNKEKIYFTPIDNYPILKKKNRDDYLVIRTSNLSGILQYIDSTSVFHKAGLQQGDIIERIDSVPLLHYKAIKLDSLLSGQKVLLEIIRDGARRSIIYKQK